MFINPITRIHIPLMFGIPFMMVGWPWPISYFLTCFNHILDIYGRFLNLGVPQVTMGFNTKVMVIQPGLQAFTTRGLWSHGVPRGQWLCGRRAHRTALSTSATECHLGRLWQCEPCLNVMQSRYVFSSESSSEVISQYWPYIFTLSPELHNLLYINL